MCKKTSQLDLEELYSTNDMDLIKKSIAELTNKQDYKILNTLFRRKPNASKFDTRTLNEDILQQYKLFINQNGKLCDEARTVSKSQNNTYKARIYDPNLKSFGYVDKSNELSSRIQSRN